MISLSFLFVHCYRIVHYPRSGPLRIQPNYIINKHIMLCVILVFGIVYDNYSSSVHVILNWFFFSYSEPKPVECSICHRRFKNIPALNGHMRLHGGYFKKVEIFKFPNWVGSLIYTLGRYLVIFVSLICKWYVFEVCVRCRIWKKIIIKKRLPVISRHHNSSSPLPVPNNRKNRLLAVARNSQLPILDPDSMP